MRVISKEFASRTRRCRSARRPPPARVHPCFPAEIKSAKATSSVRSCGTVIPKSKARPLGPPRRHPPRHLELSLDPTRPKKGTRWRRTGTRGPAPGRRAARPGLGRPQDSGRNRGQEGKRGVGVGGESRRTRADKSAPKFPRLHRPRMKRPPVRPGPPPRVRPTPPPAARPGPALTCGGLGGGARGRRGAQPQPEVQRRPEHARAQQHQPVSHWPPPPAPPRAPVARRALPRPGGGQGTCRGGGRRPCDGSRRSRRRPGASRFPAASLGTSDAGGGGPWAAGAPPLAGPPHAPHPAPPPSLSLAPPLYLCSVSRPASLLGVGVLLLAQAGGAPVVRRSRNYISQKPTLSLASLGGRGGVAGGPTLSMRIPPFFTTSPPSKALEEGMPRSSPLGGWGPPTPLLRR